MQFLLLVSLVSATSYTLAHESHSHRIQRGLPEATWFQERDHPVHQLFRRAPKLSDVTFPDVGTDDWKKGFPTAAPDASAMPESWSSKLDAAVKDGKIPDIPQTTQTDGGDPTYPEGTNPNSQEVCSSTYQCRTPDSIWDGPAGYFGISFDDGPLPFSDALLDFLKRKGEKATHFMIGQNILENPNQFKKTFQQGHDVAVHTYTHRAMTTLNNKDVVAELGWTMQLIHNSTGGLVPKFWRPPYGDSDTRVQAIAREVFGLKTIIWNQDTNDWGIAEGSQKKVDVTKAMAKFVKSSKSKGLIVLEHESSKQAVDIFTSSYASIKSNGWKTKSLVRLVGDKNPYQNVDGNEAKKDDRFLNHNDAPQPSTEDPPSDDGNEDAPADDSPEDEAPPAGEDGGDDGGDDGDDDGGDDDGDVSTMATTSSSADDAEETDGSGSSDDDSSSSDDDSSSSDDDSSSSDDDSSSSDDDTSSVDDTSSTDDTSAATADKGNGALSHIAGLMSGTVLIALCIAPAAAVLLG